MLKQIIKNIVPLIIVAGYALSSPLMAHAGLFDWVNGADNSNEFLTSVSGAVINQTQNSDKPDQSQSDTNLGDKITPLVSLTLFEKISAAESKYGLKDGVLQRVIGCESHFDPKVYGDHGVAYGIAQFHEDTFNWLRDKSGMDSLKYKDLDGQLELMGWAFQNGYASHWTCWKIHSKEFSRNPIQTKSEQVAVK